VTNADLVLVDTLVWSAFFSKPASPEKRAVDLLLDEDRVALIGPILAEVLRGFRRTEEADWVASRLRLAHYLEPSWEIGAPPQRLAVKWQAKVTTSR
jgi:predicted nucleic acid-binding protein